MKSFLKCRLTLLWSAAVALLLAGCVDTDSGTIPTVDQRTMTKFVNLTNLGPLTVNVDGGTVATIAYGTESSYLSLPTGVRNFVFHYGVTTDTLTTALSHDSKISVFSVYDALNGDVTRTYNVMFERRTYPGTPAFIPQAALIRFINLSRDTAAASVSFSIQDSSPATADILQHAIEFGTATAYSQVELAYSPQFFVVNQDGDTLAARVALAEGRYSAVLFGNNIGSTMQVKVFKED